MDPGTQRQEDLRWLGRTLELARRGSAAVEPNPRVGALLVRDGRLLGEGWHRAVGLPHAEIEALEAARRGGQDVRGATLYVSLEPCHRQGRTPPCTRAILDAGIARVVHAMSDPNPAESGRSGRLLEEAGVAVTGDLLAAEAELLNEPYVHLQRTGLPFVLLKCALTLNGMMARGDGSSRWISGEPARRQGHAFRAAVGAVALGAETVLLDRPRLDLRLLETADAEASPMPRPVVFDSDPPRCPIDLDWSDRRPLLLLPEAAAPGAEEHRLQGWQVLGLPTVTGEGIDLEAALRALAGEGIASILVEGGGRLLTSFLTCGLWQRWELFLAPRLFPRDGRPLWTSIAEGAALRIVACQPCGEDLRITLEPGTEEGETCSRD